MLTLLYFNFRAKEQTKTKTKLSEGIMASFLLIAETESKYFYFDVKGGVAM